MLKQIAGWLTAPQGFVAAGVKAGVKRSGKEDVAVILSTVPAAAGAVFTQNKMCAAPVLVSRKVAQEPYAQAIVVNSGCANACTGEQGLLDAVDMQATAAELLAIEQEKIYVCSTGVIGQFLPMDKIKTGIADAIDNLDEQEGESAALAIQTTDTFVKRAAYEFILGGKIVRIAGIAKGSGMIHPNMATMLTFITTDAAISPDVLKRTVKAVADLSFNMVVVDGDTSTNDTMIVLANGLAENEIILSEKHPDYVTFFEALLVVAQDLAKLIARDGEGATKFLEVQVTGAKSFADAKSAAMAICKSPLVKTAFFGKDPNWGRIVCAAGYSGAELNADKVSLSIGGIKLVENGLNVGVPLTSLSGIMEEHDISLTIDLAVGDAKATVWTCDFSYDYVKINAEYHT
ncbi:MAG TPA: bifunctional glutamate N-acetyltransferase/amino-acid acetyltransferase ArgJ [Candidatus Avacidaminococcus intestinavium]|uniref:Arginine biosynthesis bifunctional protein ArgJ n=1 Tax=Candidatus Avacidaminococcus intestinavium TaxID=2840684 RepID=A0A9D1SKN5_9FIRM|nr:bifunctional glutamate N-acetyltransferase/amino-acid acetyltransferase ArgJ [Candidatus Avacidaminococcus intestinavium]